MAFSKIDICNSALALIGAELIRDFDKQSKSARVCEALYKMVRDRLLMSYDWSCARVVATLTSASDIDSNSYGSPYEIPVDCMMPRDILPSGTKQAWHKQGKYIFTSVAGPQLQYTKKLTSEGDFDQPFVTALTYELAASIAPSVKGDVKLSKDIAQTAGYQVTAAQEADAGVGSEYRYADNDPNNDTFVNPDGETDTPFEGYYGQNT